MSKRNIHDWEIKLGVIQVIIVFGVACGCILGAYVFGLYTGRRHGFDAARSASATQSPRIPITRSGLEKETTPEDVSKIYAKLRNSISSKEGTEEQLEDVDIPEISPIKTTIDAPVIEDLAGGLIQGDEKTNTNNIVGGASNSLLEPKEKIRGKTLGSMIRQKEIAQEGEIVPPGASKIKEPAQQVATAKSEVSGDPLAEEMKAALGSQAVGPEAPAKKEVQPIEKEAVSLPSVSTEGRGSFKKASAPKKIDLSKQDPPRSKPKIKRSVSSIPKGWFAQVSAPREIGEAQALVSQLKASGFRAFIERAQFSGQSYYRVVVGPEEDRQQAERLREQLSREKYIKGDPFIRKIK